MCSALKITFYNGVYADFFAFQILMPGKNRILLGDRLLVTSDRELFEESVVVGVNACIICLLGFDKE